MKKQIAKLKWKKPKALLHPVDSEVIVKRKENVLGCDPPQVLKLTRSNPAWPGQHVAAPRCPTAAQTYLERLQPSAFTRAVNWEFSV